jgi:hypothetical protein
VTNVSVSSSVQLASRMKASIGLGISFAALVVQWYVVAGFIAHAYTWWIKVRDLGAVSAGIFGTVVFFA